MIILNQHELQKITINDCFEPLIDLDASEFVLEPMYYKWKFSDTNKMRLRVGAVEKLRQAKKNLPIGWNFKIWDGFRTFATQKLVYDNYWKELQSKNPYWSQAELATKTEVFVARPSHDLSCPSPHNTGGVVDLTIVDSSGKELDMGTTFDEFNFKSFTDHFAEGRNHSDRLFYKNRMLLKDILEDVDFVNYREEWWHYSYGDRAWALKKKMDFAVYGSVESWLSELTSQI